MKEYRIILQPVNAENSTPKEYRMYSNSIDSNGWVEDFDDSRLGFISDGHIHELTNEQLDAIKKVSNAVRIGDMGCVVYRNSLSKLFDGRDFTPDEIRYGQMVAHLQYGYIDLTGQQTFDGYTMHYIVIYKYLDGHYEYQETIYEF